jgi:hypothetical protein
MSKKLPLLTLEEIAAQIFFLRGQRVMLDHDLSKLYGVPTKVLCQAVKRNIKRFPEDFMYLLTRKEDAILRSQIVTSSWGGRRYLPSAFTEQGVAMLSSVLKSQRAIEVNIRIMRAFVRFKEFLLAHKEIAQKLEKLASKVERHDKEINTIFNAIRQLIQTSEKPQRMIGFHP